MQIHPGNALFQTVSGSAAQSGTVQNNPQQTQQAQKPAAAQQLQSAAPQALAQTQNSGAVNREMPMQPAQNFPRGSFIDVVV
ncbi:MAG: hypothetical protein GKS01_12530 [Alphaproteobacteria bacterium]|nr:hypothetical protein [Alphaproteobacteria bacterium]